jgi:hypothetical protein
LTRSASLSLVMLALLPVTAWAQTTSPTPAQPETTPAPVAPTLTTPVEPPPAVTPPVTEPATPTPFAEPVAPELTQAPAPVAPAEAPPEPEPEFPKKLSVGTVGFFNPGALLQGWFLLEPNDETTATFRLRRAEIKVQGEIIPKLVGYSIMVDPARALDARRAEVPLGGDEAIEVLIPNGSSPTSIFQDFFITYMSEFMDVSLGQFKIPVSYEGYNSSSKLLFAERAAVSRLYGDRRDIGLRLAKTFDHFGYSAGIFNGTGQNTLDANASKDLGLRLEVYPIKGLLIAGVVYASVGDREDPSTKDRYEADLRFESGGFLFQGEFIHGRNGAGDAAIEGNGFYAALAYAFMDGKIQPAVRVGYLDPDASQNLDGSSDVDEQMHIDVGLTYYVLKQEAKLLLNYYRIEFDDLDPENQLILAAQVSF